MGISSLEIPKTRNNNNNNSQTNNSMGNIFSINNEPTKQALWQKIVHYFIPYEQTVEYSRTSSPSSSRSSSRASSSSSSHENSNNSFGLDENIKNKRKYHLDEHLNLRTPTKARKIDFNESTKDLRVKIGANKIQHNNNSNERNVFNFSKISIKNPDRKKKNYKTGYKLSKYKRSESQDNDSSNDIWRSLSFMHQNQDAKVPTLQKDLSHLDNDPINSRMINSIKATYQNTANKKSNVNSNDDDDDDDDVIFISERKIPVYEKLNKKYNDRLVFDKKYFELVYQKYLSVCEDQKKERDELLTSKIVSKETILPKLSEKQLTQIRKEFNKSTRQTVRLSNRFKIDIYNTDLATLKPGQWLNSTIIEYFLKTLEAENDKLVAFSPFFITKLSNDGFNSVRRWLKMKKKDIMNLDKILIPINLNENHWVCSMVDFRKKQIVYLDSMCNNKNRSSFIYLERIKEYVIKQSENKIGQDFEIKHLECPQQNNGFDCGIFVLMNLLQLAKDFPFILTQKDASSFRYHIANEILTHGI
ncbi:hypothetical protein ACO0SA_003812 [Hanseniaspora valbyensis]